MLIRLEALELAANAADSEVHDKYALGCIKVLADGSVIATDGHAILRIQAAVEEPILFDDLLPVHERGYEGDVLVDAGDARDFKAACRKALKKAGKLTEVVHVVVARNETETTMATADGTVERRFVIKDPIDPDKFPEIDRLLPKAPKREITLNVDLLINTLRTLKKLKVSSVVLGLTKHPGAPITITAKSKFGDIDGAIMPMRGDEKSETAPPANVDPQTGEIKELPPSVNLGGVIYLAGQNTSALP